MDISAIVLCYTARRRTLETLYISCRRPLYFVVQREAVAWQYYIRRREWPPMEGHILGSRLERIVKLRQAHLCQMKLCRSNKAAVGRRI